MIPPALGLSNNYPMLYGYNAVPRFWRINGYNQLTIRENIPLSSKYALRRSTKNLFKDAAYQQAI